MTSHLDGRLGLGPVQPTSAATHVLNPLPHADVRLAPVGWLGEWQRRNSEATIPHVLDHLESGEATTNLARLIGRSEEPFHGMFFTDSDIYKLLEAVAWANDSGYLDDTAAKRGDKLIDLLRETQQPDGYLNSRVQGTPGLDRWADPQWGHELYTAGNLFQAAVAAIRVGVMPELVDIARRFADLIVATHGGLDSPYIDGHPQVETAMVELYRATGERAYLDFARAQIDRRGHSWLGPDRFGSAYFQDHEPIQGATRATGHAVRQLYLLAGAVDVAVETVDRELLHATERLWEDLFATKTYVSGAHGSRHRDESIGDAYELPPDRAYAETCAAIASFQWNWRLLLATGKSRYAQEMETALYNAIAVSTSVSGKEFFYSNPLQLRADHDGAQEDAPSQRLPWYSCACCPPNIARLLASVQDYLVTATATGLTVHQYTAATVDTQVGDSGVQLSIASDYPHNGAVAITVDSAGEWALNLRIPAWCTQYTVAVNGVPVGASAVDGYVTLRRQWAIHDQVMLHLAMPVRMIHPHPRIDAVRGCVAVARGPIVYALEQAGLEDGLLLEDLRLTGIGDIVEFPESELTSEAITVQLVSTATASTLYSATPAVIGPSVHAAAAIPYYRWANRSPGAMRVWIPVATPAQGVTS